MADLYTSQPLSAFVRLRVAGSSTDEGVETGDYDWDAKSDEISAGSVNSSHVVIDFSWRKPGSDSGETSFNLTLFDETAIYIESLLANKEGTSTGLYVEYGWAYKGKTIRKGVVQGSLSEYSLSFNGPSTELNVVGHMNSETQLSEAGTTEFSGKIYQGNPSEIVRQICGENGWTYDSSSIVDTVNVYESGSSGVPKTYLQNGKTLRSFINEDLAQDAVTAEGQSAFKFFVDQDGKAYFKPYTSMTPGEINISLYDENGALSGSSYAGGGGSASDGSTKNFYYYAGKENNEVISFTPNYTFSAGAALSNKGASVNSETGETFAMTIAGTALNVNSGTDGVATMDGSRILGLSMSSYSELAQSAKILWEELASKQITATLEILGDPGFGVMGSEAVYNSVSVTVYTKYGIPHHTSGTYNVTGVEESVSGGLYITTLELMKVSGDT